MKLKKHLMVYGLIILIVGSCFILYNQNTSAKENKSFKVCIDPGHQKKGINIGEPNAPGSSLKKPKVSSGTRGVATKKWEYEVNLNCSLILKDMLEEEGYDVILTRNCNEVNISNIERANIANNNNTDITIKIHCDSVGNSSKTGSSILVPAKNSKYTSSIYEKSYLFANELRNSLKEKDIKINGIFERNDLTGFNWSKVPVITLEMGFMSNANEDYMLNNIDYERKIMSAVKEALISYKELLEK